VRYRYINDGSTRNTTLRHERTFLRRILQVFFRIGAIASATFPLIYFFCLEGLAVEIPSQEMTVLWTSTSSQHPLPRLDLYGMARAPNGTLTILTEDRGKNKILLVGADKTGAGQLISVPLKISAGRELQFAASPEGSLWIGGSSSHRITTFSGRVSNAYLAKLDTHGSVSWEREYGGLQSERAILGLTALGSGDVFSVGKDDERTWLARISGDGKVLWEKKFGGGKAAAVAYVDNKIWVASFDERSDGSGRQTGQEKIAIWRFNDGGDLLDHQVIDDKIQHDRNSAHFFQFLTSRLGGYPHLFVDWSGMLAANPVTIIKLDANSVAWRSELPQAFLRGLNMQETQSGRELCRPRISALPDGTLVLACSIKGAIVLSYLDERAGEASRTMVKRSAPMCDGQGGGAEFVTTTSNGSILIVGSDRGCSWLGEISGTPLPK
jgi:hypothetical protein